MTQPFDQATLEGALKAGQTGDNTVQAQLTQWETDHFPQYMQGMTAILSGDATDPFIRQLAGLVVKNALSAKDEALLAVKRQRWEVLGADIRDTIKAPILQCLRSPIRNVSHTAAQAASEIAAMELPHDQWPQFLPFLLENVRNSECADSIKASSLECIGYCCERISILGNNVNEAQTDGMLNVIIDGITANRPSEVRLAAATALRNSLSFAAKNMEKQQECQAIMQSLMEATRAGDERIREMAYEGIVSVAVMYYSKLTEFMTSLYQLTTNTINSDSHENVVKSAIEFWTSLCEVEQDLIDEAAASHAQGKAPDEPCMNYVAAALQHLVPILCTTLTKQDENAEEEDFTVHMAGQLCLTNVSQTVENLVVPVLVPFIQQHISSTEWRYRDAAVMAFISMLEGPKPEVVGPYVQQSVELLLNLLNDENEIVRDSAAHCIARICLLHVSYIPNELFAPLLSGLNGKCKDGTPKVASQAASAIFNLAQAFQDQAEAQTNPLSPYLPTLLTSLLGAADRQDSDEANLRVASMEAIAELISVAAMDTRMILAAALPEFIGRFETELAKADPKHMTAEQKNQRDQILGLLCAVIQSLYRQLDKATVVPHTDKFMGALLKALTETSNCQEECLSAISAVADVLEADFDRYMEQVAPRLVAGVNNFAAYQVCIVAVGTVGDICRNIEGRMQPYCDPIMTVLAECLKHQSVHRSVKPPVLSCFGDIAMAIGAGFQPYLNFSMMMLMQAGGTTVDPEDEDLVDYLNLLRESVLEAYVGIIQGLRDGKLLQEFSPYVTPILQFLAALARDPSRDDYVLGKAVGLLGDIAMTMPPVLPRLKQELNSSFVSELLADASNSGDQSMMETAQWATNVLNQAVHAS